MENKKELIERIKKLEEIVFLTLWMARRYADMRMTFAPESVNRMIMQAHKLNLPIDDDAVIGRYARDGMLGAWDDENCRFEGEIFKND